MSTDFQRSKLAALRARTDRQLVGLINHELERGLDQANAAAAKECACAERHRAQAEQACTIALKLLPAIYSLGESERRGIEAQLSEVRAMLDRLPVSGESKARTAGA